MPTSKRLAGPGFIILNVIRAMNITGLLAACVASFIMLIKTFTASQVCVVIHAENQTDMWDSSSSSTAQRTSLPLCRACFS